MRVGLLVFAYGAPNMRAMYKRREPPVIGGVVSRADCRKENGNVPLRQISV